MELAKQLRRTMTPAERVLWRELRANRMRGLQFRRQQVIVGYIADFYCDAVGLIIEVDGPIHEGQQDWDNARQEAIEQHGITVLRFTNDEVLSALAVVLEKIGATIDVLNPSPGLSPWRRELLGREQ
ncbi:MAG: DUF559 domain-containing protein [Chloroflexi bacterium]|nr:DUF559 domain-containing protein [Chloroflexota bacterium]